MATEAQGKLLEAIGRYQKARPLAGDIGEPVASLGRAYALQGKKADALKVIGELKELSKRNHTPPFYYTMIHSALGDKDQAMDWLEKAYEDPS